ncbi:MAG TPA: hypothetical protein VFP17_05620 [Solirubrobacterales bacterium]|nr:hypothetical protein [Solirubrobacterales bacterium]
MVDGPNRYSQIVESIFLAHYEDGANEVEFDREDIVLHAERLGVPLPKNLGDVVYSFRFRTALPKEIEARTPPGLEWVIRLAGRGRYKFVAVKQARIFPAQDIEITKIPDATPGVISMWALNDEQALLAMLRYNRLLDIFTGATCYSLQNHLRTTVPKIGQVETDEIYIGISQSGAQQVLPVQAKGGADQLSVVQIEQDLALCADKFPELICRPIAAQFVGEDRIALFEFEESSEGIGVRTEMHYLLV